MKYLFLKQWMAEYPAESQVMEGVYLLPELFIIQLKGGKQLCINLIRKNSFPFFAADAFALSQAKPLWQKLKKSTLLSPRLAETDRIIYFPLQHRDIYGELQQFTLVAELMPPQPNVILLNKDSVIVDSLFKYSLADNPQRQILPNLAYQPPKSSFVPEDNPIAAYPDASATCNGYFENLYRSLLQSPVENSGIQHTVSLLSKEQKKLEKKLKLQLGDLENAEQSEHWLACAEALKPNLQRIATGQTSFTSINYLDPGLKELEVKLLADKSPKENLHIYLKKFHKAKNGLEIIKANLDQTRAELARVAELLERVKSGAAPELINANETSPRQMLKTVSEIDKLLGIRLGDDYQIVIGRKAKENDFISTQLGKPHDYWFHSRIYHGAHVLLRCFKKQTPPPELIELCCALAAGYSKAKNSLNVPVDYTQLRYVRKPRKSAPGFVTYTNHHSVYASPLDIRKARELLCAK